MFYSTVGFSYNVVRYLFMLYKLIFRFDSRLLEALAFTESGRFAIYGISMNPALK